MSSRLYFAGGCGQSRNRRELLKVHPIQSSLTSAARSISLCQVLGRDTGSRRHLRLPSVGQASAQPVSAEKLL